jgi:predicted Rossmann-fold nucleotide-binding protein
LELDAAVSHAESAIGRAAKIFNKLTNPYVIRKPFLEPSESWVPRLLENMKQFDFVTQHGAEYVNQAGKPRTDHIHTAGIALSGDAVRAVDAARIHFRRVPRVTILGASGNPSEHGQRFAPYADADVFVLPEGGPHAAQQFLEVVRYLKDGMADEQPAGRLPKELVVTNYGFYRPLLMGLFGLPPSDAAPSSAPVREYYRQALETIIGTTRDGSPRARVVFADSLEQVPVSRAPSDATNPKSAWSDPRLAESAAEQIVVSHAFFGSAQQHKLDHWDRAFGNEITQLLSLIQTDLPLGEPPEKYHAYEANSGGRSPALDGRSGKAESFYRTIYQALTGEDPRVSREEFLARLKGLGVDAERGDKLTFITDDRGIECPDWHLIAPYFPADMLDKFFEEVEYQVGGHDPGLQSMPGAETTWFFNKFGGVSAALELIDKAYEEYEKANPGVRIKRRIRSVCAATLVQVDLGRDAQSAREAKPIVRNFSGSTTYALRRPPEHVDQNDSFSWCVPEDEIGLDDRSVEERIELGIDGAYEQALPWMKVKAAMEASGVKFVDTGDQARVRDYRLHTLGDEKATIFGQELQRKVRNEARLLLPRASALIRSSEPLQLASTAALSGAQSLFDPHAVERWMQENDGLIVANTTDDALDLSITAYVYFSAHVAKHEHPDRKRMLVLLNGGDPRLEILRRQSRVVYGNGLAEKPSLLSSVYTDSKHALARVQKHWERYRRVPTAPIDPFDPFDPTAALMVGRTKRPPLGAFFSSAKSVNDELLRGSQAIGRFMAEIGWDMGYGGGSKAMMLHAAKTFSDTVKSRDTDQRLLGVSTPMVIKLENADGQLPPWLDIAHIASDIVMRMKQIVTPADFGFVDKGGDGTLQELAFVAAVNAAVQKAEKAGIQISGDHPLMRKRTFILLNAPLSRGQKLYDPFIEFYAPAGVRPHERYEAGREALGKLGIHEVTRSAGHGLEEDIAEILGL